MYYFLLSLFAAAHRCEEAAPTATVLEVANEPKPRRSAAKKKKAARAENPGTVIDD